MKPEYMCALTYLFESGLLADGDAASRKGGWRWRAAAAAAAAVAKARGEWLAMRGARGAGRARRARSHARLTQTTGLGQHGGPHGALGRTLDRAEWLVAGQWTTQPPELPSSDTR